MDKGRKRVLGIESAGSKTWAKPLKTRSGLLSFSSSFGGRRPWMTT